MTKRIRRNAGGWRVGESHGMAKLSDKDVELIRTLYEEGLGYGRISKKFECGESTVRDIVKGRTRLYS